MTGTVGALTPGEIQMAIETGEVDGVSVVVQKGFSAGAARFANGFEYFSIPIHRHWGWIAPQSGAESGAVGAQTPAIDADLQAVIDAWPTLADDVKARILAMVKSIDGE